MTQTRKRGEQVKTAEGQTGEIRIVGRYIPIQGERAYAVQIGSETRWYWESELQ